MSPKPSELDHFVDQYLNFLMVEKGLAPKTIEAYASDLAAFIAYLKQQEIDAIDQADTAVILKYIIDMRKGGRGPTTRARHLVAMRGFFQFLLCSHQPTLLQQGPA